ncbi:hypothetical protein B0O80DRAFT_446329 [Mortierella sp. GBAus27b]|nr:hypothetical protein B0O80DRAFT_446329 [Mortierella sp. GBAus27b]
MSSSSTSRVREQAVWLSQQYSPWCLLHMLLKQHSALFSVPLLEELLPPFSPQTPSRPAPNTSIPSPITSLSQSLTLSPVQPQDQQSPTSASLRPKAHLSRYLIQRLHFGYYGTKSVLSESAVRYLTTRARLEFGYFVIRGRAFWKVLAQDLEEERQDTDLPVPMNRERDGRDTKSGDKIDSLRRQRQQQQQQARQGQNQGHMDDNDPGGNKDEDSTSLDPSVGSIINGRRQGGTNTDAKAGQGSQEEQRQRIQRGNQKCEEREEILLMVEAVRYLERQRPELLDALMADITTYSSPIPLSAPPAPASSERQSAASLWRCVALTRLLNSQGDLDDDTLARLPPTPFLGRRKDRLWLEHLQLPPVHASKLKDSKGQAQLYGTMRMVQDDGRLFQTASGIFHNLATYPRKWPGPIHSIIDGPLSYSPEILKTLIYEYGYMPLPDDEADRKMHSKGGERATTGDHEVFPSDGSHIVNKKKTKGPGSSIWYFYEMQRVEVMVSALMYRTPEVLDWLFERGFELMPQPDARLPGISRTLLLQCCIPNCHAMVRDVFQEQSAAPRMQHSQIVFIAKTELLGCAGKPARIQFQQEDFAQVLKGMTSTHLERALKLLVDFGMDVSVVQDRLTELLQIPGGLSPLDVEEAALTTLYIHCIEHAKPTGAATSPEPSALTIELVNRAIQQAFEVEMGPLDKLDQEWKCLFEETILNFRQAQLIVHPNVSHWVMGTMDPEQVAFQICFDHALLEALSKIAEWNVGQLKRLRKWAKNPENDAIKRPLVVTHKDKDILMQDFALGDAIPGMIGLDIEWTTTDQIGQVHSTIVADVSKGIGIISVSDDKKLQLENGYPKQELLCGRRTCQVDELDTFILVEAFLSKEAIVQEKHFIWLATGLVTASLQGPRVIDIPNSKAPPGQSQSIPVRMECSPQAYLLVWMLAFAYVRQSMLDEDDIMMSDISSNSEQLGSDDSTIHTTSSASSSVPDLGSTLFSTTSTSSTWLSLLPASVSKIRELQRHLTDRLGADARLVVEILSEVEFLIKKQFGEDIIEDP